MTRVPMTDRDLLLQVMLRGPYHDGRRGAWEGCLMCDEIDPVNELLQADGHAPYCLYREIRQRIRSADRAAG